MSNPNNARPDHNSSALDDAFAEVLRKYGGLSPEEIAGSIMTGMGRSAISGAVAPKEESRHQFRPTAFRPSGEAGVMPVPEKVAPDVEKQLLAESHKRDLAVRRAHGAFIAEAQARGATPNDIKMSMIDAMNQGVLPPVVRGQTYRGNPRVLKILHGEVPADLFRFAELQLPEDKPGEDPKTLKRPQDFGSVAIEDYDFGPDLRTEFNPYDPNAFYVESVYLPAISVDQQRADRIRESLSRIDTAMSMQSPQSPYR